MSITDPVKLLQRLEREPGESAWVEFKLNNARPEEIASYISALANSAMLLDRDRAFIVFGLADGTRERIGTNVKLGRLKKGGEGLQNWLARVIQPELMIEAHDFEHEGRHFAILAFEPTYDRPVSAQGIEYIRIGEHKKRLADHPAEERALWLATSRRGFEDAVALPNQSPSRLLELLDAATYYDLCDKERPKRNGEVLRAFAREGFIKDNLQGGFDILNLGAILLANDLNSFPSLKGKSLRIIKYKGKDKREAEFEEQIQQGYALAFRASISKIVKMMPSQERYLDGVRKTIPMIPDTAVREVTANALIHQDFTMSGIGPVVELFENRIEVANPGSSLIEPDRMLDERRSRNEKLASVMRDLGLCEERGGGLDKAVLTLEQSYLPAPDFISSSNGMRVVLFGTPSFNLLSKQDKIRSCYFHCVLRWMSHDYMSNSTLRERFGLEAEDYQAVSTIISETIKAGRITPADPQQGKRNAKYVPHFVR